MTAAPTFSRAWFDLQSNWVGRVVELTGIDRVAAWQDWTAVTNLEMPGVWQVVRDAVISGNAAAVAHREWLATLTARRTALQPGCFWYELEEDNRQVRLHFANREGRGVLSPGRQAARRAELAATLADAQSAAPEAERLRGGSWLYHLPGYRALFPRSFLDRAIEGEPRNDVGRMALWGQFVRGDGTLYQPRANQFIRVYMEASSVDGLLAAFPLRTLDVVGPLRDVTDWLTPD
ncbi:hypothetical protein ABN034_33810 [Actinopolymorpha sp. B11F2]|uniref:hypothetical protein n=1 Tax=Actinopolymorpha sp. B11F2 TaxID=3160862 RepID=UPI0032E49E4F